MESVKLLLIALHIAFGSASFLGAGLAISSRAFNLEHRWHQIGGRIFFYSMAGIFATGLPVSIIGSNVAMFFISMFSFYLAWMGRRYANNRRGIVTTADRVVVMGAIVTFALMLTYGLYMVLIAGASAGIVVIVFGALGLANATGDFSIIRGGGVTGSQRIAEHLGKMMGGTIAIVTAFVVTNVRFEPAFIIWLAPAVILTPLIIFWSARTRTEGISAASPK